MSNLQQTKEIYKKLPQKIRDIIASPELNDIVESIAKGNNLDKKQQVILGESIIHFLMGMDEKKEILNALSNKAGVDDSSGQRIFNDVEKRILNNLDNIYEEINKNIYKEDNEIMGAGEYTQSQQTMKTVVQINQTTQKPKEEEQDKQKNTAEEQRKYQPQEGVGGDFERIILNQAKAMQPAREAPGNLPVDEEPKVVHDYPTGNDPYREPVE